MFKKNGGFTLVELIVVIAILAILAGIAVPTYGSFVSTAQEEADAFSVAAESRANEAESALALIP